MAAYGSANYRYYVHYHALTYLKQEYKAKDFPFNTYARGAVARKANKLQSGIGKQQKEHYLQVVNAIMGRKVIDPSIDQKNAEAARQSIENLLQSKFNHSININTVSGAVTNKNSSGKLAFAKKYEEFSQKNAMSTNNANQFIVDFEEVQKEIAKLIGTSSLSQKDLNKLLQCEKELKKIEKKVKDAFNGEIHKISGQKLKEQKNSDLDLYFLNMQKMANLDWILLDKTRHDYLNTFNKIVSAYNAVVKVNTNAQGEFFEDVLAAAGDVCNNIAIGAAAKQIHDITTLSNSSLSSKQIGNKPIQAEFLLDGMPIEAWEEVFGEDIEKQIITNNKNQKVLIKQKYSQGKVDTIVNINTGNDKLKKIKQVPITAKSYSDLSSFSIVKNTTLWSFLQNENSYYTKAYLNTMAKRSDHFQNNNVPIYGSKQMEINSQKTVIKQRQAAIDSLKLIIMYKATTGDMLGRLSAKWLVLNDVSKQKVYLIELSDLFLAILKMTQNNSSLLQRYCNIDGLSLSNILENTWAEAGPEARMGSIINQVHSQKISASFNNVTDFINKNKNIEKFVNEGMITQV